MQYPPSDPHAPATVQPPVAGWTRRMMRGDVAPDADDGLVHLAGLILAVLAGLVLATAAVGVGVGAYGLITWRRTRWWPPVLLGLGLAAVAITALGGPAPALLHHLTVLRELTEPHPHGLGPVAAQRWPSWLLAQLPLVGMFLSVAAVVASAAAGEAAREGIWAVLVVAWMAGGLVLVATDRTAGFGEGVTKSLVERVGSFTIIVLGEVVVGVVGGMSQADDRTARTIATGVIGLTIGMGLWWNYFDLLGRRVPGQRGGRLAGWLYSHLPLTMAIAAGGAAMVSLVEHAADSRTPAGSAWLLAASVAAALTSVTLAVTALPPDEFPAGMARQVAPTFGLAAAVIVVSGAARPSPMVLVTAVSAVLVLAWGWLFIMYLALGGLPEGR